MSGTSNSTSPSIPEAPVPPRREQPAPYKSPYTTALPSDSTTLPPSPFTAAPNGAAPSHTESTSPNSTVPPATQDGGPALPSNPTASADNNIEPTPTDPSTTQPPDGTTSETAAPPTKGKGSKTPKSKVSKDGPHTTPKYSTRGLADNKRIEICQLLLLGWDVTQTAERAHVSKGAVYKVKHNLNTYGSVRAPVSPNAKKLGKPPKLKEEDGDALGAELTKNGWLNQKAMVAWLKRERNVDIAQCNVSRLCKKRGWDSSKFMARKEEVVVGDEEDDGEDVDGEGEVEMEDPAERDLAMAMGMSMGSRALQMGYQPAAYSQPPPFQPQTSFQQTQTYHPMDPRYSMQPQGMGRGN